MADKDFLEHLRTVHFTLLASCLALLVVVFAPTKSEIEIAHQQIRDVVEVTRKWDSAFLDDAATNELKSSSKESDAIKREFCNPLDGYPVNALPKTVEVGHKRYNTKFRSRAWGFEVPDVTRGQPVGAASDGAIEARAPRNLTDFRNLWDQLKNELAGWGCGGLIKEAWYENWTSDRVRRFVKWQPVEPSPRYQTIELEYSPFLSEEHPEIAQQLRDKFVRHAFTTPDLSQEKLAILVAREVPVVLVDGQALLIAKFPQRWRHGLFVDSFYELNKFTSDYQDISLDGIERIVRAEAERSRDSLEAFGVKFPVETASRWGLLIIMSVQLYFALHLAEYARLQRSETMVAWIGSYPGLMTRVVFSISSFIFPVFVVVFVSQKSHLARSHRLNFLLVLVVVLLAAGLSGAAAYSYFRGGRRPTAANQPPSFY